MFNKRLKYKRLCLFGLFLLKCSLISFAQNELHYSQFYNAPCLLNPGLTSVFNGDVRFAGNYRSQWKVVPVPYTTFSASYDEKFYPKYPKKYFFGGGANFNYDYSGDGKFSLFNLNLLGSVTYIATSNILITPGIGLGFAQRSLQSKNLNFGDQWDGEQVIFNPTTGEQVDLGSKSIFYPDLGGGLNIRLQKDSRTKIDVGAGFYHITKPKTNFYDGDNSKLPVTASFYAIGGLKVLNPLDLLLHAAVRSAGEYKEVLVGGGAKIYLSTKRGQDYAIVLGLNYRTDDAIVPTLELHMNQWKAGVSYDINNSPFEIATDKKGGLELSLQYIITKVKILDDQKSCPIF